jgi:hypothetical protein
MIPMLTSRHITIAGDALGSQLCQSRAKGRRRCTPLHTESGEDQAEQPCHNKTFLLVDGGAYPKYCRFVRTIKPAITAQQKMDFARWWQEGARNKNIEERVFEVLQCTWKALCSTPILQGARQMQGATNLTACCIILTKMCVSDRMVKDDNASRYNPSKVVKDGRIVHVEDAEYFPSAGVQRDTGASTPLLLAAKKQQHRAALLESFFGRGDHHVALNFETDGGKRVG